MEEEESLGLDPIDINTGQPIDLGSSKDYEQSQSQSTELGSPSSFNPDYEGQFISDEYNKLFEQGRQLNWNLDPERQALIGQNQVELESQIERELMLKEELDRWDIAGRALSNIVNKTGNGIARTFGEIIDVGDWRIPDSKAGWLEFLSYLPNPYDSNSFEQHWDETAKLIKDAERNTIREDYAGQKVPLLGQANELFKLIDNTIGDGENKFGNAITRWADKEEARLGALNYIPVDENIKFQNEAVWKDESRTLWDKLASGINWDSLGNYNYFMSQGSQTLGSALGFLLTGAGITKAGTALRLPNRANQALSTFALTQSESQAIARQVYDDIVKETLYEMEGDDYVSEEDELYQETYNQALKENDNPQLADFHANEAVKAYRENYLNSNPNLKDLVYKNATKGAETALQINGINFLLNLTSTGLFLRGTKPITRNLIKKPSLTSARQVGFESLQEMVEEGAVNYIAEIGGKKTGMGERFTISDAFTELATGNSVEDAFWGAFAGGVQTVGTDAMTFANRRARYKERYDQQKPYIDKWNEIGKSAGNPDLFRTLTVTDITSDRIAKLAKMQEAMINNGNIEGAEAISDKMFYTQAFQAFETGTTNQLIENLNTVAQNSPENPDLAIEAKDAIASLTQLEQLYLNSKRFLNSIDVYNNRANNMLLKKQKAALELRLDDQSELANEALGEFDFDISSMYTYEDQNLVADLLNDNVDIRDYDILKNNLATLESVLKENNSLYQMMTSRKTQKELVFEKNLANDIKKIKRTVEVGTEEYVNELEKVFTSYANRINPSKLTSLFNNVMAQNESFKKAKSEQQEKEIDDLAQQEPEVTLEDIETTQVGVETQMDEDPVQPTSEVYEQSTNLEDYGVIMPDEEDIENFDDLFQPERLSPDLSPEQEARISEMVNTSRDILSNRLGRPVTFKEHIQDVIKEMGEEFAETRFNIFRKGYELSGINANFDDVYNSLFANTADLYSEFEDITSFTQSPTTTTEHEKQVEKIVQETKEEVIEDFDDENLPVEDDFEEDSLRTSEGILRAAYLSIPYQRMITEKDGVKFAIDTDVGSELNQPEHIDSNQIMHPDKFIPGTRLTVKIPENFNDIDVADWIDDYNRDRSVPFSKFSTKYGLVKNSQNWIEKVPMIAYDKDNNPIFFIHDTDWYKPVNIGFKNNPQRQSEIIEQGKENLRNIRRFVIENGEAEIEILKKRPGTFFKTDYNKTMTINQANPQAKIGLFDGDSKSLIIDGKTFNGQLLNWKDLNSGHAYDVRRALTDDAGNPTYIALPVMVESINEQAQSSVTWAMKIYLSQNDNASLIDDREKLNVIHRRVKDATGLDLYSAPDLEKYLRQFVHTVKAPGLTDNDSIERYINTNSDIAVGTPYIATQSGDVVFGVKGKRFTTSKKSYIYGFPGLLSGKNPAGGARRINNFIKATGTYLADAKQHIDKTGLKNNKPVAFINVDGSVESTDNYNDYLKNNLRTNIKSFNVGTEENPMYATIVQPTLQFERVGTVAERVKEVTSKIKEEEQQLPGEQDIIQQAKDALDFLGSDMGIDEMFRPTLITDEQVSQMTSSISAIPGLSVLQTFQLTDFIFNQINSQVNFDYKTVVNKKELLSSIRETYEDIITEKKKEIQNTINNLKGLNKESLNDIISELESRMDVFDIVRDHWIQTDKLTEQGISSFETLALNKVRKYTGLTSKDIFDDDKIILDDTVEEEKDYSKSSLEENGKSTASYRLKRFFSGIQEIKADGTPKKGFLGVPTYVGFDTVYSTVEQIISSPYEVDSNFDLMMERLTQNKNNQKWIPQLVDKLKQADQQIKNEFVYNFARHTLSMKFVMFAYDKKLDRYNLKVYDTNSTEITRVIQRQWNANMKQRDLVQVNNDGQYAINKDKATELLEQFNSWKKDDVERFNMKLDLIPPSQRRLIASTNSKYSPLVIINNARLRAELKSPRIFEFKGKDYMIEPTNKGNQFRVSKYKGVNVEFSELRNWLNEFGVVVSPETIEELFDKGIRYKTDEGSKTLDFNQMFNKSGSTRGVFGLLANELEQIASRPSTEFEENENNNPLNNAKGALKSLARIESKYSLYATTNSFRDGDKSIYGFTPTKYATDRVRMLKTDQDTRDILKEKSFNGSSLYLKLIDENENIRDKFYIDHLGITAIKELGKKVYADNSITSLSDIDHELVKLGMFQDMKQGSSGIEDMRMSRMFLPTMSDKSQMLTLFVPVFDIKEKSFVDITEDFKMTDQYVETLYSQLVEPELKRIVNFHGRVKETTVKGYDLGAQIFQLIPELNNIKNGSGHRVIQMIAQHPDKFDVAWFNQNFKAEAKRIIESVLKNKAEEKVSKWIEAGFVTLDDSDQISGYKYMDSAYMKKFNAQTTNENKIKIAAYDFVYNSLISNANMFMLLAGDPALYSQDKISKSFIDGKPYLPKSDDVYAKISRDIIGTNIGKRLALLIAPGNKLAESQNDIYRQVFLNDMVDITTNVEYLVDLFYGEQEAQSAKLLMQRYNQSNSNIVRKEIAQQLSENFPEIADYFDIEATDAQEYTTLSEHINVIFRQGRMDSNTYKIIQRKIQKQKKAEYNKTKIPEDAMLTSEELKIVLQPIKPVYTDQVNDPQSDMMRTVYIKSSSFPLIPQVTSGLEIDALRRQLERFEDKIGQPVRASYQTANKVGANKNAITPFNPNGTANENELSLMSMEKASVVLNRSGFRIQQDVPFKSGKRKEDRISIGTQVLKLLFGDGVLDLDGFKVDGKTYKGRQLYNKFREDFDKLINLKKESLFKSLGRDENGDATNTKEEIKKLKDLLTREAEDRGYPRQDIEALSLYVDSLGNPAFTLPLWLSPNSNRYESLLNSVVTNKLINIKIPGNSFVAGTEAGMRWTEDMSGIDQSRVIYTKNFDGNLKATFHENGRLKYAQVMLPSKFRMNDGRMLDLYKKDRSGKYKYLVKENGRLMLNEEMIDSRLLNITSFRIPTSSHVSISQIEIVGILPPESGDLMIAPMNLIKQKGLDFDIDKEYSYQLWSYIADNGKIEVFDKAHADILLKDLETSKPEKIKGVADLVLKLFEINTDIDFGTQDTLKDKILRLRNEIDQKLLENEFVKVHSAVLSNPATEMQKKINKVLSMDFARSQADLIEGLVQSEENAENFSILSDEYQKSKMFLGSSGKLGIGVYSNYVVFHSLVQQTPNRIHLMTTEVDQEGKVFRVPYNIVIGNITSDGTLGRNKTLGKRKRSVAEVFAEKQNTATDNEKEQIMGKVNVNEVTINIDSLLSALGFDKDTAIVNGQEKEVSIPYLFLSQPIIRDYVEEIRKTKSNTATYDPASESKVIKKLLTKYNSSISESLLAGIEEQAEFNRDKLTAQELVDNFKHPNNETQATVLQLFLELQPYAKHLGKIQNRLNITNGGLGKSMFDTIDKVEGIESLSYSSMVENISELVGDFVKDEDFEGGDGYLHIGKYFVKPSTPMGSILVNSVFAGDILWTYYFPYDNPSIDYVMNEIIASMSGEIVDQKKIEIKQNIFAEMKKFLFSSEKLNIFEEKAQNERARLFFDRGENTSLASYLSSIVNNKSTSDIVKDNKLISRFEYDLNKDKKPSLIKFDNSKGENFDEDYLYNSLIELMEKNIELPSFNGEEYSSRKLAQDLIAYSYLEGGIQEAIQFAKYIPIDYLNIIGFSEMARKWQSLKFTTMFSQILGVNEKEPSLFTRQYFQHNPERLPKIDEEVLGRAAKNYDGIANLTNLVSFTPSEEDMLIFNGPDMDATMQFVAVYNSEPKSGFKKFNVYQKSGSSYIRIPTLGIFGMSEYQVKDNNYQSLVNDSPEISFVAEPDVELDVPNTDFFSVRNGNLEQTIGEIIADENAYSELNSVLLPNINKDTQLVVQPLDRGLGRYSMSDNTIYIDERHFNTASKLDIAKTITKEFVHSLTANRIAKYAKNGQIVLDEYTPRDIVNLSRLFKEFEKHLGPELEKFRDSYQAGIVTSQREAEIVYAGINVFEFVEMMMTEPALQKEAKNIQYKATKKSLYDKFVEVVERLLKAFGVEFGEFTADTIANTIELIERQAEETKKKFDKNENDQASEELLQPVLAVSDEISKFEDPFKCK